MHKVEKTDYLGPTGYKSLKDAGVKRKNKRICGCSVKGSMIAFLTVGAVLLTLGLMSNFIIGSLIEKQIKSDLPISSPSSQVFDVWQNTTSQPMYTVYYVFNVSNSYEVEHKGAFPILTQHGPYVYKEIRSKFDIRWSENENIVSYKYNRFFKLIEEKCNGRKINPPEFVCTEDDSATFVTPNVPLQGVINKVISMGEGAAVQKILEIIESFNEPIFKTLTARKIVFGYEDPLLKVLHDLRKVLKFDIDPYYCLQTNYTDSARSLESSVYTGKDDLNKMGSFTRWENMTILNSWEGCEDGNYTKQANMINGTEGIVFHPLIKEGEPLQVYTEDLLRSSDLFYDGKTKFKDIELYRYRIAKESMMNSTEYPPNCGFNDNGPTGVLNMTSAFLAPIYASKPMFYEADPVYRSRVAGLDPPSAELHDTFLDIEPWTGSVMRAHQRLQINLKMHRIPEYGMKNLSEIEFYLPIMWADEQGYISEHLADQWKGQIGLALSAEKAINYAGIIGGAVFILMGIILIAILVAKRRRLMRHKRKSEQSPLLNDTYGAVNYSRA